MTQEQKDLLIKDICARLPYGVKVSDDEGNVINVVGIHKDAIIVPYAGITRTIRIDSCRPYLFPMSSMTDEQNLEYLRTCVGGNAGVPTLASFDWCDKNHFDYRGLIPMGLAEDATNKNIY